MREFRAGRGCGAGDRRLIRELGKRLAAPARDALMGDFAVELARGGRQGGELFNRVVGFLGEQEEWTVGEIRGRVAPVSEKALSNCIDYCVRSGRLERVVRGKYRVVK